MTRVAILPVPTEKGDIFYHAIAGETQSHGKTAGEALDALTAQLPEDEAGTLIIVQNFRPDHFFDEEQQRRLAELMTQWRTARDAGAAVPAAEQVELNALIEKELRASTKRTVTLLHDLA